jgi:ABC-2 type transport system permease protein
MKRAFLVARQEFIKYVTRRGFALSILMFPLWIMIVILVPRWTGGGDTADSPRTFTILDRSGGAYREAILGAVARDNENRDLRGLSHYALAYSDMAALRRRAPAIAAMLEKPDLAAARRALRAYGLAAAVYAVEQTLKPGAPRFESSGPHFIYQPPPEELVRAPDGERAGVIKRLLSRNVEDRPERLLDLDAVVVIPPGYGPATPDGAQFWSAEANPGLRDFVAGSLTQALRLDFVLKYAPHLRDSHALTPVENDSLTQLAILQVRDPVHTGGGNSTIDSIVPIALAIILFVVSVMNSSVLLQGVVEEKSTRMIEVLLSCATAREITTGKLIGVIAVALTTLLIWALALFILMAIASHDTVTLVFASLRATASLQTLPLLLVFFLCGLLIYGSLFLAIGSMANSLADAQSLLGPSMLILMLPNLMISGIIRDPNGTLASTLSWVPIYTPFFMMLRISSHPPVWQLWGTLALAVTTTALLIWWTGRVFAKHVLTTERPPSFGALIGRGVATLTGKRSPSP